MKFKYSLLCSIGLLAVLPSISQLPAAAALFPTDLRCEYTVNPAGIDLRLPRLFWKLDGSGHAQRQSAWQILTAPSLKELLQNKGSLWDSSKVSGEESIQIHYGGKPLLSSQQVFWKVRVWDQDDRVSSWSKPASWTMGLLNEEDWHANWICAPANPLNLNGCTWIWFPEGNPANSASPGTRYFRKTAFVRADFPATNAVLLLTADNSYVAYINGAEVGHGDDYTAATPFAVQRVLHPGMNLLAVAARNAGESPNPAGLIGKLVIYYADGGQTLVQIDDTWRTTHILQDGWKKTGFDDRTWRQAVALGQFGMEPWKRQMTISEALPIFRRKFTVKPGLRRALVFVCGLGQYEMTLNGRKTDHDLLSPGWTKYDKTCLYDTRDVTSLLHPGENAAGIVLGPGMYDMTSTTSLGFTPPAFQFYTFGPLRVIAQIRLEYADGSVETVGTDEHWRTIPGPITFSSIYDGENFDARKVPPGWDQPNYDDSGWSFAKATNGPGGTLRGLSCAAPPIRAIETIKPVSVRSIRPGATVYDLGQNIDLMPRIVVQGSAGSTVKITSAELIRPDGSLDDTTCGGKTAWNYVLKGGQASWMPRFFYRGARYLEIECVPAPGETNLPVVQSMEGVAIQSISEPSGEFECSNDLFNQIHELVRWAQRNNMVSVLTDCPHREKRAWLEQYHLNGPSLRYEFNLARLYTKGMQDMEDSQLSNGLVPTTAPEYTQFGNYGPPESNVRNMFGDSPEWSSAVALVPWQQYEFYGDMELFRVHYHVMKAYVRYLGGRATNDIVDYGLGDWLDIGPGEPGVSQLTPRALTATAFTIRMRSLWRGWPPCLASPMTRDSSIN